MLETIKCIPESDVARFQRSPNASASRQIALQDLNNGRHAPALARFQKLVQEFPAIPQFRLELGLAAAGDLEFALADQAFEQAMALAPANAAMLVFIGAQYYHLRRMNQAFACLRRALDADPSSADARLTLAAWLERDRRMDEAWECVETCMARHPQNGWGLYLRAFLLHRRGLNGEAETALRDLLKNNPPPPPELQTNANHLLGIVLDALGQYAEALAFLTQAKTLRLKMQDTANLEKGYEMMDRARRVLLAELTPQTLRRWREEAVDAPCPHPLALLGGAMRSGTTLIEQILGTHPEILALDETPSFGKEVANTLQPPSPTQGLTLKSLDNLPAAGRARLIARYFRSLLSDTEENPRARLLLDKNPSTTGALHIWLRLFPRSKVVIALRDPRDVVISCYFQNFPTPWATVNFSSLKRTARFYADCMDVWLRLRELDGFEWIETRYEDVVGNLEREGRRVTNFLGLPWRADQAAYYETSRRKFVHSPTYDEVTKPVYTRAVKRWESYAEAMAPLQARLEPYLRNFGYS
ncbi:MAG: sulfotransferase [Verrucomicrobiota bacterium]|jgi:tetratricopeptide (TPR) repeat protein